MENTALETSPRTRVNVTVRSARRPREYLTEREIEKLIEEAKSNRQGHRDATAVLIAYRHGLRASELVALRWDDIDFRTGKLHVRRAKGGTASVHPLGAGRYAPCAACSGKCRRVFVASMSSCPSAWRL
jgi:type 1 fimbriae regulatory protein FimB/type 1 fimbriae regulatory protein FimE